MSANAFSSRIFFKQAPFIRLLFPCLAGILMERKFSTFPALQFLLLGASIGLIIFYQALPVFRRYESEWICGIAIQLSFFSLGCILVQVHTDNHMLPSKEVRVKGSNLLLVRVSSNPVPKKNAFRFIAEVRGLLKDHTCYRENERVLIYINHKLDAGQYSAGSWLIIQNQLSAIENKTTDFDYKKYCALRHIYNQDYLNENAVVFMDSKKETGVIAGLDSIRGKLLIIIKNRVTSKSDYSLLEALMVGFTDDLDPDLLKSYSDTGVIHIIAISGLHLALICHLLQFLLRKTGKSPGSVWLRLLFLVTSLWAYSLLSGASPSVIRSAAMFSLVLLASAIHRENNLYNTLAASAFLLLCFDPGWMLDTGFQLSYAAVLSLRLFAKPIKNLIRVQNKSLAAIWDAASVSLAAQILTTPLTIFYFHRFPNFFLIANLIAVPLSSIILLGGMGLAAFYWFRPLAALLGSLLGWLIELLNGFIRHLSELPGAVVKDLSLSLPQLLLIYGILFCTWHFLKTKTKAWLFSALMTICLMEWITFW